MTRVTFDRGFNPHTNSGTSLGVCGGYAQR
jgi:hypothetical protein